MANVHIVYAHPSERSFTREVLDAFLGGLDNAGHRYTVSDLYAMEFRSELTLDEYERESGYRADAPVPDDVAAEHAKLNAADVWAFIYPVWWADCPAAQGLVRPRVDGGIRLPARRLAPNSQGVRAVHSRVHHG